MSAAADRAASSRRPPDAARSAWPDRSTVAATSRRAPGPARHAAGARPGMHRQQVPYPGHRPHRRRRGRAEGQDFVVQFRGAERPRRCRDRGHWRAATTNPCLRHSPSRRRSAISRSSSGAKSRRLDAGLAAAVEKTQPARGRHHIEQAIRPGILAHVVEHRVERTVVAGEDMTGRQVIRCAEHRPAHRPAARRHRRELARHSSASSISTARRAAARDGRGSG